MSAPAQSSPYRVGRFWAPYGGTYHKRWQLRRLRGEPGPFIDATAVRAHLIQLHDWGLSYEAIARGAAVSISVVCAITTAARSTGCRREIAAALLAVSYRPHPAQHRVLAIGARRRIHALVAIGHPMHTLAPHLGLTAGRLRVMIGQSCLPYRHWAVIAELYDRLCTAPGPSEQSRKLARNKGWSPPLAWDEGQLDNPEATPAREPRGRAKPVIDQVAIERALAGDRAVTLTWTERSVAYQAAAARGMTARQVCDTLGVSYQAADRAMNRARTRRRATAAVTMLEAS